MKMKEIKAGFTPEKRRAERIEPWAFIFARPLSFPLAWICIKMGLTATAVSYLSLIFVIAAAVLLAMDGYTLHMIGISLFSIWLIFDHVDGNIARATKTSSLRGEFADAVGGYVLNAVFFSVMGIVSLKYNRFQINETLLLSIGYLSSMLNLLSRLLYQKQMNLFGEKGRMIKASAEKKNNLLNSAHAIISASGLMLPLATVAMALRIPEAFLALFFPINFLMFAYTLIKVTRKKD